MIFVNMVALLAYNLLQRQIQQQGLQMTTRRLIERLEHLSVIETHCWDGSSLRRLTPVDADLMGILEQVAVALDELVQSVAGPSACASASRQTARLGCCPNCADLSGGAVRLLPKNRTTTIIHSSTLLPGFQLFWAEIPLKIAMSRLPNASVLSLYSVFKVRNVGLMIHSPRSLLW